jgi:hypothetical protein
MAGDDVRPGFLMCVQNDGFTASLELRKVYQRVPDALAAKRRFVRVIDESGEDYLYPEGFFAPIELSQEAQRAFSHAS